jgi:hypothetical protein
MRDQTPPQLIKGPLAGLRVLSDNPLLLTGCPIVSGRSVKRLNEGDNLEPEQVW